jgi:copper chaperone NosL
MGMKRWRINASASGLLFVILLSAGCSGAAAYQPEPIREGADTCIVCKMPLPDGADVTEIVTKDGRVLKFDDLGDMYQWIRKNGMKRIGARFVRDHQTKEWIRFEEAAYVFDKSNKTPMMYGVYSFKNRKEAETFAGALPSGKLLMPQELDAFSVERMVGSAEKDN